MLRPRSLQFLSNQLDTKTYVSKAYRISEDDLDHISNSVLSIAAISAYAGLESDVVRIPIIAKADGLPEYPINISKLEWQENKIALEELFLQSLRKSIPTSLKDGPVSPFTLARAFATKMYFKDIVHLGSNDKFPVEWVEHDSEVELELDVSLRSIGASAHFRNEINLSGRGQNVAVIDGRMNVAHPALQSRASVRWDQTDGAYAYLGEDHATRVAGIIAGNGRGIEAETDYVGVAPNCTIANYAFTPSPSPVGSASAQMSSAITALEAAARDEVRIVNLSWGVVRKAEFPYPKLDGSSTLSTTITKMYQMGILVVKSAGNAGEAITIPGDSQGALTVGATIPDGSAITDQSAYGPTADGRVKPEVCAPSPSIAPSTEARSGYSRSEEGYTSFAAPIVTGLAALLWEHRPEATVEDIRTAIISSAQPIESEVDNKQGFGLVDLERAISSLNSIT